jgi:hypothetical protein
MSKYYVNKFHFQVDGDPELPTANKASPAAFIERWELTTAPGWARTTRWSTPLGWPPPTRSGMRRSSMTTSRYSTRSTWSDIDRYQRPWLIHLGPCRPTTFFNVRQSSSSHMVSRKCRYRPPVNLGPVDLIAVPGVENLA